METHQHTCPQCGEHDFIITVQQTISVGFTADGEHQVYDGPGGDMEWDDSTDAICCNADCGHCGPLGEMKPA